MGLVVSAISYGEIGLKTAFVIGFVVSARLRAGQRAARQRLGERAQGRAGDPHDRLPRDLPAAEAVRRLRRTCSSASRTERPEWLTLPGNDSPGLGVLWFMSTCILNGVTFTVFPSFVAGYLGSKSAEHDPPQRDLPADVLAAAARAGDARHGRAVRRPQPRDQRPRAADDGHARAAGLGRGHRRRRGRAERDRPDGRVHALHRHAVGRAQDASTRRRAMRRGRVRPRRAGRRAAVPGRARAAVACSPTRASRSSSRRSSAACCGGG